MDINDTLEKLHGQQQQIISILNCLYDCYFVQKQELNYYEQETCGNIIYLARELLSNQYDTLDNLITETLKIQSYNIQKRKNSLYK